MMDEILKAIESKLTAEGSVIVFKPNSVLSAMELPVSGAADIGNIAGTINSKLASEILLFKTKIKPLHDSYVEKAKSMIEGLRDLSEASKYNIQEQGISNFIIELFNAKLAGVPRPQLSLPVTSISIPLPADGNIRSYFKPNINSAADITIEEILGKYDDAGLIAIWNKYFGNFSGSNSFISVILTDPVGNADELALVIAGTSRIKDEKPDGLAMEPGQYKDYINLFYGEFLNAVSMMYSEYQLQIEQRKLVLRRIDPYTVLVNKDTYKNFLESGGRPEIIFGVMSLGMEMKEGQKFVNDLTDNFAFYMEKWDEVVAVSKITAVTANMNAHRVVHDMLVDKFYNELLPEDLKAKVAIDNLTAVTEIHGLLNTMEPSMLTDIPYVTKEIFGKVYFKTTNYLRFIDSMLEYGKQVPGITPVLAATFAAADMVMDYLFTQVTVEKV